MFFFNFGMKFQDSKPEIKAPESKTYILHCKMYVFGRSAVGRQDFDVFFLNQFLAISGKTYILQCKMYVFAFSNVCQKKYVVLEVFLGAAKKV
jgi:hypothetical protein